jgi:outer membrane protein insertion porin family
LKPLATLTEGFFVGKCLLFSGKQQHHYPVNILRVIRGTGILLLIFFRTLTVCCQPSELPELKSYEVDKIEFKGNIAFDANYLKEIISSKETPSGFSKFLYHTIGEKLGSKPELFSSEKLDADSKRLKQFYGEHGFYEAEVKGEYTVKEKSREVTLLFSIHEGERSFVDVVNYIGLDSVPRSVIDQLSKDPVLQKGMPYESAKGASDVARILSVLVNNGYPKAQFDVEHSAAYHNRSTNTFMLQFVFIPGKQLLFGGISIHVDPLRDDITDNLTLRELDFQTGDIYSRSKKISSEGNLNRLDLFETARIDQAALTDSSTADNVPVDIFVRPRPRNELSPEVSVSDENNAFNLGVGLGYSNRNFFGDARTFSANVRARTQSLRELFLEGHGFRDSTVVGAVSLEFQILQPYLFTRTLSGSWTSTISAEKQKPYILSILRNKMGLKKRFATYTTGYFDWTLERVSPEFIADTVALRPQDEKQLNSILTFTLQRDKTNGAVSPVEGFFNSITLEESGILPELLPGIQSGLPFTQYYKVTLFGRWYDDLTGNRFNIFALKLKTGYQDKYGESRSKPVSIPLNRRFFAGGSGSVRGWKARELGAMPNELLEFGGNFVLEGSAELRVNHFRGFSNLGFIKPERIWGVYFLDFGNVWSDITDFKLKDIAVAAGVGFRYETFFGPFRIDYGFRLYDPKEVPGRKTIFQKKLLGETLSSGVIHIGIGHAF